MHRAGIAACADKPIAKGEAGARFVGGAGGRGAGTLRAEPVGVDEVRRATRATAVDGQVFSRSVDFAAIPDSRRADLGHFVSREVVQEVHAGATCRFADTPTVGVVHVAGSG